MTEDTFRLSHQQQREYDLAQLSGLTVQQAIAKLSGHDYITEITLFVSGGQWVAHPVGGPWEWLDTPPMAHDLNPISAVATLMALSALPTEENP